MSCVTCERYRQRGAAFTRRFPNGAGKPRANGSLCDAKRRVLAHAKIAKRFTIAADRDRSSVSRAVDPVAAKAIIGHTTDRMREHYSTVNAEETRDVGARVASLVPAVGLPGGGCSPRFRASCPPPTPA
jgi:hypothetical protein